MKLLLNSIEETIKFGQELAQISKSDDIFCLRGNLGSGKTTIARAFISFLTKNNKILSPTFPMLITYDYKSNIIWHYDMYRLTEPADVWNLNLEDALNKGIILIEWPEIIKNHKIKNIVYLYFEYDEDYKNRYLTISSNNKINFLDEFK